MKELEITLVEEIRIGNIKSFELIFKGFYPRLCKYAYSLIKDYDLASDIVKDFFVKWWENREKIEIKQSLSGYLYRSVHNLAINHIKRSQSKLELISESDLENSFGDLSGNITQEFAHHHLEMEEMEVVIGKAIDKLPDQCREIFILSRIEQLTHEEIAQKIGISANTVKVQIYRALIKLRTDLKDYLPFILICFLK